MLSPMGASSGDDELPYPVGTLITERYRVERKVGAGGMGTVYAADDLTAGRKVAVKVLSRMYSRDQRVVERFQREARMASQARHPNIIEVSDLGQTRDGRWYIAMELLDGLDLHEAINLKRTYEPAELSPVLDPVLSALEAAHALGLVHRDLKPENIFLARTPDGEIVVKLLDFGVVKVPPEGAQAHLTRTGTIVGTPEYMAPEQAMDAAVDRRADLYSLGCVAYTMLCGESPFADKSTLLVLTGHVVRPPVPPSVRRPSLPSAQAVDEFLGRALEKKPDKRYQSAAEMRAALAVLAAQAGDPDAAARPITLPDKTSVESTNLQRTVVQPRTASKPTPVPRPTPMPTPQPRPSASGVSNVGLVIAALVGALLAGAISWWIFTR